MKTHDYIYHYRGYWSDGDKCHLHLYQERRTRETGELESRLAALEKLLSELIPAMEIRGHEPAPIREMDWRLGY